MGKKRNHKKSQKVEKSLSTLGSGIPVTVNDVTTPHYQKISGGNNPRGINTFSIVELQNVLAQNRAGERESVPVQNPLFILTPLQREEMVRKCAYLLGVITSRQNRISSLEWKVCKKRKEEDKIANQLKSYKQLFDEYDRPVMEDRIIRVKITNSLRQELPDLKDDLSNFNAALLRWSSKIKEFNQNSASQIQDWLETPNNEDNFDEYRKKWIMDLMTHGTAAHYKCMENGVLQWFQILPGGSVIPLRDRYVGGKTGYVQYTSVDEPKLYYADEMFFDHYIPISSRSYGLIPLEALINKIAETLLFDDLAANRADGTRPPEKVVVFGAKNGPFGDLSKIDFSLPLNPNEQQKIEKKINTAVKEAIVTLSGVGQPVVIDISKADTFSFQSERQEKIKKDIAMVYNMSAVEIGLMGGDDVSGRATSETGERQEREKGIYPLVRMMDNDITKHVLPYRYGDVWMFETNTGLSDAEQARLDQLLMSTGTYLINEVRELRGDDPLTQEQLAQLQTNAGNSAQPGATANTPLFMSST